MIKIIKAFFVAKKAHKNQFDKANKPYIFHPIRVSFSVKGYSSKVLALVHDVIEDSDYKIEDLNFLNAEEKLALSLLTRRKDQDYFDYISQIKGNSLARQVKLADLKDNMNLNRLNEISEEDLKRLDKYKKAKKILLSD